MSEERRIVEGVVRVCYFKVPLVTVWGDDTRGIRREEKRREKRREKRLGALVRERERERHDPCV